MRDESDDRIDSTNEAPTGSGGGDGDPWVDTLEMGADQLHVLSYSLEPPSSFAELTPAERDVVSLALAGRSNREIAEARSTSPSTIAKQLTSVFRKLGVGSRHELVAMFFWGLGDGEGVDG